MLDRIRTAALLLLLFALVALAQEGEQPDKNKPARQPQTSRKGARQLTLPKEEGVFHFAVYGDRTGGPIEGLKVLEQAVRDTNLLDPDLVMTVGDLIPGYTSTRRWLKQTQTYSAIMNRLKMPWYPVAGNHDVYWRGRNRPRNEHDDNFEKHFGPLWYSFRHKNAVFVVLYSDEGDPKTGRKSFHDVRHQQMSKTQLDWLRKTLVPSKSADHVFVFIHHPRWIARLYPNNNWRQVHQLLVGAGNVSAVFGGHIHRVHYAGKRDGIEYHTLATTGGGRWADLPGAGWLHHMNIVTVRKRRISVSAIPIGQVIDPKQFTQRRLDEVDRLRGLQPVMSGPLKLDARGAADMQLAVGVTNPTTRPIAIDLGLTSQDPAWSFKPEHLHAKIEAGATKSFPFQVQRTAGGFGKSFRGPQLTLAVDYLDAKVRVTLPRREVPVPVTLATTPEGHFEGASPGALRLQHNSCVRVASSAIRLPDGPLTLEGWMRARDLSGRRAFLSKTENSEYGIFVRDGRPDFSVHLNGKYVSAAGYKGQLKVGRWHHLAGVYDGKQVRLYLDGKLIAKADGSGRRTLNHLPLYIGADPGQSGQAMSWFDGLIDEVRLSKVARYTANFTPPQRHDTDGETLLLHHLDRALGPFTLDHSTHQAHGLKTGTAAIRRLEKDTFRSK